MEKSGQSCKSFNPVNPDSDDPQKRVRVKSAGF